MIKVKETLFGRLKYKGEKYSFLKRGSSQIGDIALCVQGTHWTEEGNYYLVERCGGKHWFKGVIADDGEPMGIHDVLGGFVFYREIKKRERS